jgi:Flp pilus assembly CpaF family ATPase
MNKVYSEKIDNTITSNNIAKIFEQYNKSQSNDKLHHLTKWVKDLIDKIDCFDTKLTSIDKKEEFEIEQEEVQVKRKGAEISCTLDIDFKSNKSINIIATKPAKPCFIKSASNVIPNVNEVKKEYELSFEDSKKFATLLQAELKKIINSS